MLSENATKHFTSLVNLINASLDDYLCITHTSFQDVADAMKYSVAIGGKRIRPILVMEFSRMTGGNMADALPYACALEMIHNYSLVHDDLPCMDNDDYRRGCESTHKKFGENIGVLAGDGLLTYAFQIASDAGVSPYKTVQCTRALANYAGVYGMIGGQSIDLRNENKSNLTLEELQECDRLKTGALIRCACELGCNVGFATAEQYEASKIYAENLGLAFQIVDDILDAEQDEKLGKATYVSVLGLDGAKALAKEYTNKALMSLEAFSDAEYLIEFTKELLIREA